MIVNIYVLNVSAPNFRKQTLLDIKGHIGSAIIIVGDFNTPPY
jgi:endonuclease/exonuclease/phosphatase (EEP) superfamily protein YafD